MKDIPFDPTQFASAELILAYDDEGIPFLESDDDEKPRMLAGITIFLEPKDIHEPYQQKELIPCQPTLVQITPSQILINNQQTESNPQDLDQLTALLYEKIAFM